ncbi:hypothetical protein TBLA_0B02640 [Henningerozyma blattae CBS 6284]|uniref:DNA polymerase alpha subunit B n=1 Tax=Henningerozyma blattae (strain ATCC 34711 / CBS 6284 / DSM 70876 / NBRC 10599 / NRRL Y-10934 / UCD 77-7) TaxID=1071380 RepID=I2GYA4_HENB6|nr:hypothetical protein TBLA_0B02640 [Tetrapisispora blattae CBS 6284]CCH59106.1 hypothetical protein TBLA_0B02640 [Tetrapisispora blattae CBS 6284]
MDTDKHLIEQFGPEAKEPIVLDALKNLSNVHALPPDELFIKWEQFSYQRHEQHTTLNSENVEAFKEFLQVQIEKKAAQTSQTTNLGSNKKKVRNVKNLGSSPSVFGFSLPNTPSLKKRKLNANHLLSSANGGGSKLAFETGDLTTDINNSETEMMYTPSMDSKFGTSTMPSTADSALNTPSNNCVSGKVLDSLNPENIEIAEGMEFDTEEKISVLPYYEPKKYRFRTMRQNLVESADYLDDQIESFVPIVQEHYQLSKDDFGDPTIQSQSEIYAVGRIVPDSPTTEGFLNPESLALETSRISGIGRRISLNLTEVNDFSLFCGQIVALKGKNVSGDYFLVTEILSLPYPNSPVSTTEDIQKLYNGKTDRTSKIIVTSGPYTPATSFDLTYLAEFVDKVNTSIKPHAIVMFGPFIDVTNPLIASGNLPNFPNVKVQPKTLDEVFSKVIAPILSQINSKIQVVLIPSTRDALTKHAAYPQDSFNRNILQLPKNFKCFANPATFQINESFFGCSNVDVFKDMKEVTKGGTITLRNRFDRISEHVLNQRRFYPVFPGGIKKKLISSSDSKDKKIYEHLSGADLEVAYLGLTEFVSSFTPDVMIIPSELQQFARVIQNVIVINPGVFVKATGVRGSYAQLSILPANIDDGKLTKVESPDGEVYLHNVWKRARVDLITI